MKSGIEEAGSAIARAKAAALIDAPARRGFTGSARSGGSLRKERGRRRRASGWASGGASHAGPSIASVGALLVGGLVLAVMLAAPAFRVSSVRVNGASGGLVPASLVRAEAVQSVGKSIFTVNGAALAASAAKSSWLSSVTVHLALPATVTIDVVEKQPVLRIEHGTSYQVVAADGTYLSISRAQFLSLHLPLVSDQRQGVQRFTLPSSTVAVLHSIALAFPGTTGCQVAQFLWNSSGVVTVDTSCGWGAVLGRLNTDSQIAQVSQQMDALAALRTHLDFAHPSFVYINLEDPSSPAVGGSPPS